MEIKEMMKINYKLGNGFVVCPTDYGWSLLRSGSYRMVMNSKENTEEELYEFVEEHKEYNAVAILNDIGIALNLLILILLILNTWFIHLTNITFFCIGAIMILFPILLTINYIRANNVETYKKILEEDLKYYGQLMNSEEEKTSSTRAKRKKPSEVQK